MKIHGRTLLALAVGMAISVAISIIFRPQCFGYLLSLLAACSIARVSTAKEGALLGGVLMLPPVIMVETPIIRQQMPSDLPSILLNLAITIGGLLFAFGVGWLVGLGVGKVFSKYAKGEGFLF